MSAKLRQFIDDGWGIWIDGDDRSTVYLNEWLNPRGKSYVDVGVRIYGAKVATEMNVYVPFLIGKKDVTDLSVRLSEEKIFRAIFNSPGIVKKGKNPYVSELRYDKRVISLVHLSDEMLSVKPVENGTVVRIDLAGMREYMVSDEVYIIFRIPHRTIDDIFTSKINMGSTLHRLKELISTPMVTKKYGYSLRINEARLLPAELNKIKDLQQQRIRKALITISIDEEYDLNDSGCYRIRRLEEKLYKDYAPVGYDCSDSITYQWVETRDESLKAHYNFYFDIVHNVISKYSVLLYILIILMTSIVANTIFELMKIIIPIF